MSFAQSISSRPNDYIYDTSYISSGPTDYYKQARHSRQQMMKFAICPIFPSMFSDLQNYPSKKYAIRRMAPPPAYEDKTQFVSSTKISRYALVGSDRFKYFHTGPTQPTPESIPIPKLDLGCFYNIDRERELDERKNMFKKKKVKHETVQTIFRETSAQTSPWQPDYVVMDDGDPEVLKLDFLKWGAGLPAGVAEVEYIFRMRNKQNWENNLFNDSSANFDNRRDTLEALSRNEWLQRESDLEEIQKLRLQLLENMLNELHKNATCRNELRLRSCVDRVMEKKREDLEKLKKDVERKKRRLHLQYIGVLAKYGTKSIFEEHVNYNSDMYCPLMRNGTNPRYKHEDLGKFNSHYRPEYCDVEQYDALPSYLDIAPEIGEIKLEGTRLCIRETKWTLPVLKKLYEELTELRIDMKQHPNLRVCLELESTSIPTPEVSDIDKGDAKMYAAATYIQKIIRGRAAQNKLFMGRERCHELIDELRGNYALLKDDMCKKSHAHEKRIEEQLRVSRCMSNMKTLMSSLRKLSGSVTGTLLDFLNKDLQRLLRERRAHAMILLVERLRQIREAEEAGRRQKEIRRRKEHDEMFKQVVKIHQETVDLYLQDIITEGMEFTSEEKAQQYVQNLAEKLDQEQTELQQASQMDREEYIASLVHQFVIPEVEKNLVRDRMTKQQKLHLENAHREIHSRIENAPKKAALPVTVTSSESGSGQHESVDQAEMMKIQEREQQIVMDDVRDILDELVDIPFGLSVLKNLLPCTSDVKDVVSSSEAEDINKLALHLSLEDAGEAEHASDGESESVVENVDVVEIEEEFANEQGEEGTEESENTNGHEDADDDNDAPDENDTHDDNDAPDVNDTHDENDTHVENDAHDDNDTHGENDTNAVNDAHDANDTHDENDNNDI